MFIVPRSTPQSVRGVPTPRLSFEAALGLTRLLRAHPCQQEVRAVRLLTHSRPTERGGQWDQRQHPWLALYVGRRVAPYMFEISSTDLSVTPLWCDHRDNGTPVYPPKWLQSWVRAHVLQLMATAIPQSLPAHIKRPVGGYLAASLKPAALELVMLATAIDRCEISMDVNMRDHLQDHLQRLFVVPLPSDTIISMTAGERRAWAMRTLNVYRPTPQQLTLLLGYFAVIAVSQEGA